MSTLIRPELARFLTRRVTWVGTLVTVLMMMIVSVLQVAEGSRSSLSTNGIGMVMVGTIFCSALGFFSAASYIGSEQSSGALGTWLTFNPRRMRVYAAKLLTITVPTAALTLISTLAGVGWAVLTTRQRSSRDGLVLELVGMSLRAVLVAAGFAVLGFVIALIGRSTLSALGVLVGYLVLVVLHAFAASALNWYDRDWFGLERIVGDFLMATSRANYTTTVPTPGVRPGPVGPYFDYPTILATGAMWWVFLAVAVVIGGRVFSRRDLD
ncbi:hypothetical protein HJ590_02480 [Naumannella sp. ID2617S]|nr:hypothetical protein [Naumannella sp. ID2617S]